MGYANLLTCVGRHREALAEAQCAVELDPLSLIVNANQAQFLHWARDDDAAWRRVQKTLEIDPDFWVANLALGRLHIQKGEYPDAIIALTKARDFSGANSETVSLIGYAYARAGDRAQADAILGELRSRSNNSHVPPHSIAVIYHGLSDKDQTFQWLEKAYEQRDVRLTFLKTDPKWDSIRSDARFVNLVRRVGLG